MIFGYKIDESISLKILEQREAPLLFKLVDSNREYLSEFYLLLNTQQQLKIVKVYTFGATTI